jgi:putative transposase
MFGWYCDFSEIKSIRRQKLRVLCVSDDFTREILTFRAKTRFVTEKVCVVLEELTAKRGIPSPSQMDNSPEFIALALRGLCHRCSISAAYDEPVKTWQNSYAESFHSRLRDEYLNGEVFWGVRESRVGLNSYRSYFNTERLHRR